MERREKLQVSGREVPIGWWAVASLVIVLLIGLGSCHLYKPPPGWQQPTPGVTPTVIPTPDSTPVPHSAPFVEGVAQVRVTGIGQIPLAADADDFVLFVLEWEGKGFDAPVLGVHVRCCYRGDDRAGVLFRWMGSREYDQQVYEEHGESPDAPYSGSGMGIHLRLIPADDGVYTIGWNRTHVWLATPAGKSFRLKLRYPGTIGFSTLRTCLEPRRNEPYHLWGPKFDAACQVGGRPGPARADLLSIKGKTGELEPLPPLNETGGDP